MGSAFRTAPRAATGLCALFSLAGLAGCEGALGTSPPHAAPANPTAEGADQRVELTWEPVTDASRYAILWDNNPDGPTYENTISDIQGTSYTHTGLTNLVEYHYRIVAETSGGRGPESRAVAATPGPVPGRIEWWAVTIDNPGHTIYFSPTQRATHYRVYFSGSELGLTGRRPAAPFIETDGSPARAMVDRLLYRGYYNGLQLLSCGVSTLRFMPPLCVTEAEVDEALGYFRTSLDEALAGQA